MLSLVTLDRFVHVSLALATISFTLCFAAWGLIGGLATVFAGLYGLNASQTAFLVAVPVLLGSLARLPMGMLTDRYGGRLVFGALLVFSSIAAFVVQLTNSYQLLLFAAFLIGMAGSSFAVGAAFVSRWTPPTRQGTALGIYGLGTMGQSLAVFVGPVVAARFGWETVFRGMSAVLLVWAVAYVALARNPVQAKRPATAAEMMSVLRRSSAAWLLGAFYFLTFGGFVAFSIYLPTLLKAQFRLEPADAGLRAAGFVVLATLLRPVGGWLADRIGGAQLLSWVFGGVALFSLLLTWPSMVPFTVGALACVAQRFSNRLAAGQLRRAPGIHEVHGAHELCADGRAGLDCRTELVAETCRRAGDPACGHTRRCADRRRADLRVPGRAR